MSTHVWALVKRVRYLRHSLAKRLEEGASIAPDVVREGDALVWAVSRLLAEGEVEHAADRDAIKDVGFEWDELKRQLDAKPVEQRPKTWALYGKCLDGCGAEPSMRCRDDDNRPAKVPCEGRPLLKERPRLFCAGCAIEVPWSPARMRAGERSWCSDACRMRVQREADAAAHAAFASKFKARRAA